MKKKKAMSFKLDLSIDENHKDVEVLASFLKKHNFRFDTNLKGGLMLRTSHLGGSAFLTKANYIRISNIKYWDDNHIELLKKCLQEASNAATEHTFEFDACRDYDIDIDDDRSWDASFTFSSLKT